MQIFIPATSVFEWFEENSFIINTFAEFVLNRMKPKEKAERITVIRRDRS